MTVYDPITAFLVILFVSAWPLFLLLRFLGVKPLNFGMVPRE